MLILYIFGWGKGTRHAPAKVQESEGALCVHCVLPVAASALGKRMPGGGTPTRGILSSLSSDQLFQPREWRVGRGGGGAGISANEAVCPGSSHQ